jgi:hypothetical protein
VGGGTGPLGLPARYPGQGDLLFFFSHIIIIIIVGNEWTKYLTLAAAMFFCLGLKLAFCFSCLSSTDLNIEIRFLYVSDLSLRAEGSGPLSFPNRCIGFNINNLKVPNRMAALCGNREGK